MEKVLSKPIKRIALLGPESSGKSTLAAALAKHFNTEWVPEYARQYLSPLNGLYECSDLKEIAKGQLRAETQAEKKARTYLFCDTELLTIKIWSDAKYGSCDAWIESQLSQQDYDLYLLCKPDFAWQPDPLRENPDKGAFYFEEYRKTMIEKNWPFEIMDGPHKARLQRAIETVLGL